MTVREQTFAKLAALCVSIPAAALVVFLISGATRNQLIPKFRKTVQTAEFIVDADAPGKPVPPGIFGVAAADPGTLRSLGATVNRWGGNTASRYNWGLGNAWNTGKDWFFENQSIEADAWRHFLSATLQEGAQAIVTLPLVGYVAKDTKSYSFSVEKYGPQQKTDPNRPDAGNGRRINGDPVKGNDPADANIIADIAFLRDWVQAIRNEYPDALDSGRIHFALGNEPMLWNTTHRDVHPEPTSYEEYLDRFVKVATMVRKSAPNALILGPELWGWPAYFESARDRENKHAPDRKAHDDQPFLPWFLTNLRAHERKHYIRLLDILSVHYYPQAAGVFAGDTSAGTCHHRAQASRSLYDPKYTDPSWIRDTVELLPRMQRWIDTHHPGLELAVTEYKWGAEDHISGALALADALGAFAAGKVRIANYWQHPDPASRTGQAFRMYTNADGAGAAFGSRLLPVRARNPKKHTKDKALRIYASRVPEQDKAVLIVINRGQRVRNLEVEFQGVQSVARTRAFRILPGSADIGRFDLPVDHHGNRVSFSIGTETIYHVRFDIQP